MKRIQNNLKRRLQDGQLAIGVGLRQARTVDIAKVMKTAGYHWLMIDLEHSSMDIDTACQIAVAAQDAGITPLVRVPGFEHHYVSRVLDGGAQGVVVPHVQDAATAARMAASCRYPPAGERSATALLPQLDFAVGPTNEIVSAVNESTLLVVMLETRKAIGNADAIAAVPGVDVLLVGTNDLCMEMGCPRNFSHPDVLACYRTVVAACKTHGKHAGMGGIYQPELMKPYLDLGVGLVLSGTDLTFLMTGAQAQAAAVSALVTKQTSPQSYELPV